MRDECDGPATSHNFVRRGASQKARKYSNRDDGRTAKERRKERRVAKMIAREKARSKPPTRHGAPRQARIEQSIEVPHPSLPTPEPSSATQNSFQGAASPSARSESGMFVSSSLRPATPGPQALRTSFTPIGSFRPATPGPSALQPPLTPIGSPPPISPSRKRRRSVFEDSAEAAVGAVAKKIFVRFETMMADREDLLEKKIQDEASKIRSEVADEREMFQRDVGEQMSEQRSERLQFEKVVGERLASARREERGARVRHEDATAQHVATLEEQFKGAKEKLEKQVGGQGGQISIVQTRLQTQAKETEKVQKKVNGQDLRLRSLHSQVDGQITWSRTADGRIEASAQKLDTVVTQVGDMSQAVDTAVTRIDAHGNGLQTLGDRIAEDKQQLSARVDEIAKTIESIKNQSSRQNSELKKRLEELERGQRTSNTKQQVHADKIKQLEETTSSLPGLSSPGAAKPQFHIIRPRQSHDALRGGLYPPRKAVIPDTLVRKQYGARPCQHGPAAPRGPLSSAPADYGRPIQGALDQHRSVLCRPYQTMNIHLQAELTIFADRTSTSTPCGPSTGQIQYRPGSIQLTVSSPLRQQVTQVAETLFDRLQHFSSPTPRRPTHIKFEASSPTQSQAQPTLNRPQAQSFSLPPRPEFQHQNNPSEATNSFTTRLSQAQPQGRRQFQSPTPLHR